MEQLFFPVTKREADRQGIPFSSKRNRNALFPTQLRKLREHKGISQNELSKALGLSKSTIGLWETGDTLPDARAVHDLAKYFGVSADYILGLSQEKSADINIRGICEYTGLSSDTIKELSNYSNQRELISKFMARLLEDIVINNDINEICGYILKSATADSMSHLESFGEAEDETDFDLPRITPDGFAFRISCKEAKQYFLSKAQSLARGMLDTIIENMEKEQCELYDSNYEKSAWLLRSDENDD